MLPVVREREGHGAYLRLAARQIGEADLNEVGDRLGSIAQKWLVVRNLCLKAQRRRPVPVMERLLHRLCEIVDLENQALVQLQKWLDQPKLFG